MPRTVVIVVLALATVICTAIISGCTTGTPAANNTTLLSTPLPAAQRPNLASSDTIPAYGYVLLEGKNAAGANVIAISVDGTDSVSTVTNGSGAYVLNVKAGLWYRITAAYQGLQHTVFPVVLPDSGSLKDQYDINLTKTHRSTITGSGTQDSLWNGGGVYIEAVTQNSTVPLVAVTGDDGSYSIDVEPGVYYYLAGYPQHYDDKYSAFTCYRNGGLCRKIKLGQDETALVDYHAIPIAGVGTLNTVIAPPGPLQASGHVYWKGRAISGAIIDAVSIDGAHHVTANTDWNGTYRLSLESMVPYRVTARYFGLQHTIWPVYLSADNQRWKDRCDINLTDEPTSIITGFVSPHHMLIEAVPANGGAAVSTVNGYNETYSLDVQPGIRYQMTGRDYYGQLHIDLDIRPAYNTGDIVVRPNETLLLDVTGIVLH